jgi:hypothetical protein
MKCSSLKHSGRETKILELNDTRARMGPMMRSPRRLLTGPAPKSPPSSQVHHLATQTCHSSHSTQASLHINSPQAKLEQLNLIKTDPSTWQ